MSIRQDRLVKPKEKIFGIMTDLRGVYRTRGEHRKGDDVEADMDLYQSRVGKVLQEVGDKLKEYAKRTVKPKLDEDSSETESLEKRFREQSCRAFKAERFPERAIDDTPAQNPANLDLHVGLSRFFHSKTPERKMEAGTRSHLERITVYQSLMAVKPSLNVSGLHFPTAWRQVTNLQKLSSSTGIGLSGKGSRYT